ncbi:MAG: M12 family metallo-peptidase [Gammaproteobacteria bacterium]|nr:M12 family metallo-peptidase [Gammaproteobacteria bacterium]
MATLLTFVALSAQAEPSSTILHHEALTVVDSTDGSSDDLLRLATATRSLTLRVQRNAHLHRLRSITNLRLLRGRVEGVDNSWLRLTQRGNELHGIIFDGTELYGVEPRRKTAGRLQHADTNASSANVIFRLNDLVLPANVGSCGTQHKTMAVTGDQAMKSLTAELAAPATVNADGGRIMRLHVVADYEFYLQQGPDTEAEVLTRINIVDGIYTNQLNMAVEVDRLQIYGSANDPFTSSNASDLLAELSNFRLASGITNGPSHLMTGRNLDGATRGIAYLGAACNVQFGAALSQQIGDTWISALTTAHEIGHTLGAWHDGEVSQNPNETNPCQSAPLGFLMQATINGNDQLSQCSLDTIERFLASQTAASSCVGGASAPTTAMAVENSDVGGGGSSGPALITLLISTLLLGRRRQA